MYARSIVKNYLDLRRVPYEHHVHAATFTAQQLAKAERVPGAMVAKTVVVRAGGHFIMVVLPASARIDMLVLRNVLGVPEVRLATETELQGLFPDSDLGAMSPFGNLYEIPVCAEQSLAADDDILFNAGTHEDAIRMRYRDFSGLVKPKICSFASQRARRAARVRDRV
jgi:Ala-tRNA(Pro) deacylase